MKIVVLGLRGFPNIQGGVETHCEHLYTRMAGQGHEVTVLCRKPYMPGHLAAYKGVRLIPLMCPKKKFLEAIVHTFLGVLRARRLSPDILHIHAIGPSLMVPVARLLGMKVITTNHGPDYERQKWKGLAKKVIHLGEYMGSHFSHAVIAISGPIAANLRRAYGCQPEIIPNGVVVRTPAPGLDAMQQFNLEPGRYLLAVGRLVPEKGFHDLLEAFIKANLEGWKLVIAGRADHEDAYSMALKKKATALPAVVMTGFITGDPLVQLYSHAGLFVLPSYHEGLPIVLLEAMSYGLPVLASDIPANRQAGLPEERFFSPGNVEQAANKLRELAVQPFGIEQRQSQIRSIAQNFDWDVITEKTVAVYEKILAGRLLSSTRLSS